MDKNYIDRIKRSPDIDNRIIKFISSDKEKYIYGNNLQAGVCLGIFREMGILIRGLIFPYGTERIHLKGYWGELVNHSPVVTFQEISKTDSLILVTDKQVPLSYFLYEGFREDDIYYCLWKHNSNLKDICYEVYREKLTNQKGKRDV